MKGITIDAVFDAVSARLAADTSLSRRSWSISRGGR
jgi:hypothetical protein